MHVLNLQQKLKQFLKILLLVSFSFALPCSFAWADDQQTQELKEQQKNLKELLDRIGEAQDQRKEQRATLNKLEKQMSCNLTLIQDYENCEDQYKNNLEAQIKCKHEAKEKAAQCLSEAAE